MDEIVNGLVPDATGNGHEAKLDPKASEPQVVPGMIGNALAFVGAQQQSLTVAKSEDFNFAGPFTVMAWIRPTPANGQTEIACMKGDKSGEPPWPGWRLRFFYSRAMFQVGTPDGQQPTVTSEEWSVPEGYWTHLAGVWDGTKLRLFINAVEASNLDFAGPIAPQLAGRPLILGNYIGRKDAYAFDGLLDDIKVFDVALGEDGILAEASAGVHE